MPISFVGAAEDGITGLADKSVTVAPPVGWQADDVILIGVEVNREAAGGSSDPDPDLPAPSGLTLIDGDYDSSTPGTRQNVYRRVLQSGDGGGWTWTWTPDLNVSVGLVCYRGVDTTTPVEAGEANVAAWTAAGTSSRVTPDITTGGDRWIVSFFGDRSGSTFTPGDTERVDVQAAGLGGSAGLCIADSNADVAAGTISRTATSSGSSSTNCNGIVALNPASAAAPQFARPTTTPATVTAGWTASGAATIPEAIDEVTPSDGDFARSENSPNGSAVAVPLTAVSAPAAGTQTARYRYDKVVVSGAAALNLVVECREGYVSEGALGTLRGSNTHNGVAEGFVQGTFTLTGVVDYSDLWARVVATQA